MPSPTDALSAGLRQSLAGVSRKSESNGELHNLDTALAAGHKLSEITKHHVEYESSDNQQSSTQNVLKSKYVVLDTKHVAGAQNFNGISPNGTNGGLSNGNKFNNGSANSVTIGPQLNGFKGVQQNGLTYGNINGNMKNLNSSASSNGVKKLGCNGVMKGTENGASKAFNNSDSMLPEPKCVLYQPDKVTLGWQNNFRAGAGMVNLGNTCYLNATLQALFHVPAFVEWLLNDTEHMKKCEQINGPGFGDCITCSMSRTLRLSHNNQIIKPSLITSKIKMICRHMSHGSQEDAHEFMRHLLENMEKAYLNRCKAQKFDPYSKETTPINQIFGGYIRTEVKCLRCSYASTTFQHIQDLILDIRKASKVEDAMDQYFSKERLEENSYKCEKCKCGVPAIKKYSIERPPKVLCIQLKRFNAVGVKIPKPVEHRTQMDLKRHIHPQSTYARCPSLPYKLISMVTHVGPSSGCGHYTAIAQCSSRTFHHFDDTHVQPVSLQAVLNNCAYILIYEMEPQALRQGPKATTGTPVATTSALSQNNLNIMNGTAKASPLTPGGLPSVKDRERVTFGLASPKPTNTQSRIVMHKPSNANNSPTSTSKPSNIQNGSVPKETRVGNFIGPVQAVTNGKHVLTPAAKDRPSSSGVLKPSDSVTISNCDSLRKDSSNSCKPFESEKKHMGSLVPYDCDDDSSSRDSSLSPPLNDDHEVLTVKATKPGDWQVTNSSGLRSPSIHSESSNHSVASATGPNWNVTEKQPAASSLCSKSSTAEKVKDKKVKELSPLTVSYSSDPEPDSQPSKSIDICHLRAKSVERELNLGENTSPSKHMFPSKKARVRRHSISSESDSSCSNKTMKKKVKMNESLENKGLKQNVSAERLELPSLLDGGHETVSSSTNNIGPKHPSSTSSSMWNGESNSKTVNDLLKMSHQGFGSDRVSSWTGEQSQADRSVEQEKQASWKRSRDEYEMELDQGRQKKVKKDKNRWSPYAQSFPNRPGSVQFNQNRKFSNSYSNPHHRYKGRPNHNNYRNWQSDNYYKPTNNHRYYRN